MAAEFKEYDLDGKDIQRALDGWRASLTDKTKRPDWFWNRQHARVMSEIDENRRISVPRLAWAGLAVTIAVAVSLLMPVQPAQQPRLPNPRVQAQPQISDHDLMVALERSLNAGVPSSLEPATLLSDEMNQALESRVLSQKSKEN